MSITLYILIRTKYYATLEFFYINVITFENSLFNVLTIEFQTYYNIGTL